MTSPQSVNLLVALAVIILTAALLGRLARRVGQPAVIGEVLAGVLLGPTLFHGAVANNLLPTGIRPFLTALASVGVAVFMFLVGMELDRSLVRGTGRIAASVSLTSILVPCAGGIALGAYMLHDYPNKHHLGFMLFIGVAMSITAFPVLARILYDRKLQQTPLGVTALSCAAIDDVLAWSLLAIVVTAVGADIHQWRIALLLPYVLLMLVPVRRALSTLVARREKSGRLTTDMLSIVLAGVLLSGAATEWMGLHFIFGAFLFGAVMPRPAESALHGDLLERIGQMNSVLLLPVFFIVAGLKVDLSHISASDLTDLGLIMVVAVGGKFGGAFIAARLNGLGNGMAASLASLMNTRGLTELIVLGVGLQLGVLNTRLYSLMVVMAVVTTAMTGPLLKLFYSPTLAAEPNLAAVPASSNGAASAL